MLKTIWSKTYPVAPRDHIHSHILINDKNVFRPSYEIENCPATIRSLLAWEYSRRWLEERDKFLLARNVKTKRFKNDYQSWLEKRKPRVNTYCKPQGVKKLLQQASRQL